MSEQSSNAKKTAAVLGGVLLLAALGFVLFRVRDLSPGYVQLRVFMDDAAGLMDGTQVRLNGIPVGYVDSQKLTNSRDLDRKVEFILKVKVSYLPEIPVDSLVGLASDNLLGDQYVGIRRGQSKQHVQPGAELRASQNQDITRMMAQFSRQLDRLQAVVARADKLTQGIGAGSGAIGKIVTDPKLKSGAAGELDQLMAEVQHGHGTLAKLMYQDPLDKQLDSPMKRLDAIMTSADDTSVRLKEFKDGVDLASREFASLQTEMKSGNGSLAKFDQLQSRIDALMARLDSMKDKVNSGQGTLGQLLVNPQLNEALAGTTREFQEFAKGLRANPRKFVTLKIF